MTTVVFTCKQGLITRIECSGHTGYAHSGKDIVCAAVSSVVQTAVLGVLEVAKVQADYRVDENAGYLCLQLPEQLDDHRQEMAQTILQTARLGVEDIVGSYPQFVKMEVK